MLPRKVMPARKLVGLALMGALMLVTQVAMAVLPNVNLVSMLIILTVLLYGRDAFFSVYIFVLLEGLIYGFTLWFINYLYVWAVLTIVALLLRKNRNWIVWAVVAAVFGLCFGALCAIPYFFIGGPAMALAYWVSGIPFDVTHCISNFIITLVLLKPCYTLLTKLKLE